MEEVYVQLALAGPSNQELAWGRVPCIMTPLEPPQWVTTRDAKWSPPHNSSAEIQSILIFADDQFLGAVDLSQSVKADALTTIEVKAGALRIHDHPLSVCLHTIAGHDYTDDFKKLQKELSKRVRRGRLW